ncbi:PAAR domain-containing protein [Photobacterium damselae]|uniref:PAAR domain-containing protein n=1 Tax=Photobacterium damselae TaxID=38293 RepID=UPI003D7C9FB8
MVKIVTKGTKTSSGGEVLEGHNEILINGQAATSIHQLASCKSGRKSCKGMGEIVPIGQHKTFLSNGLQAVLPQYKVMCNCPDNVILEPSHHVFLGSNENGEVNLGQHSGGISIGNGVNINTGSGASVSFSPPLQEAPSTASQPIIDPKNAYWPPYNFLAKEGEKEIHIRYTQDVVETTVLAPEEWKEFFDALDKTQNISGAMKGTYDAFDTAKKLGGLGVTAYVKTHNGVDYLILKGYKQHMKTLLAGNRFKASNPQVVKLGLGSLDSAKGMVRYVKVTAPMEILVGSAINVLQFVLNDEYTLRDLGVDEAKVLINALAVAGAGLFFASLAPAFAATVVGSGLLLVGASFSVWVIDQFTDFEKKTVNKVLEQFDD